MAKKPKTDDGLIWLESEDYWIAQTALIDYGRTIREAWPAKTKAARLAKLDALRMRLREIG